MSSFLCCFTPKLVSGEGSPKKTPQVGFTFAGSINLARVPPQAVGACGVSDVQEDKP